MEVTFVINYKESKLEADHLIREEAKQFREENGLTEFSQFEHKGGVKVAVSRPSYD
jgi:hypothetical protein